MECASVPLGSEGPQAPFGAWSCCEAGVGCQLWRVPDPVVVWGGNRLRVGRRKGAEL